MPWNAMLTAPTVLVFSLLLVCLFVLARSFRNRGKLAEEEAGLTPLHNELCGGSFGWLRASSPFVRLRLYEDMLVAVCLGKRYVLHYSSIESVTLVRVPKTGKGLLCEHSDRALPAPFILCPDSETSLANVATLLRSHGVDVDMTPPTKFFNRIGWRWRR